MGYGLLRSSLDPWRQALRMPQYSLLRSIQALDLISRLIAFAFEQHPDLDVLVQHLYGI